MGRRSEHTPEGLRLLIIEASEGIVATHGLAGLSAREIARAVGYSPGTIYNMFENLDDLILQIEARMLDDLAARLTELPTNKPAVDCVLELAHTYLKFTTERPRLWNLLFEHHLPQNALVPGWYQDKLDALMYLVEQCLQPLVGSTDPTAAAKAARVLWAGVHGITSLATAEKLGSVTSDTAGALLDDLVRNYLFGLERRRQKLAS